MTWWSVRVGISRLVKKQYLHMYIYIYNISILSLAYLESQRSEKNQLNWNMLEFLYSIYFSGIVYTTCTHIYIYIYVYIYIEYIYIYIYTYTYYGTLIPLLFAWDPKPGFWRLKKRMFHMSTHIWFASHLPVFFNQV